MDAELPVDEELVVVGAGPFGLAVAADARRHGVRCRVLGEPMGFWRHQMPPGMVLRSDSAWHLDVAGELTIARFLAERGQRPADVEPLAIALYLEYAAWFQQRAGVAVDRRRVTGLQAGDGSFTLELDDGAALTARGVVLAVGQRTFAHVPPELVAPFPPGRWTHTCDLVDLARLRDRRVLVVGGRQSAYEWSALLLEAGAAAVTVVHRHPAPAFTAADWSWTAALMDRLEREPGFWRSLPAQEQRQITARLWAEGRLKLEPWLAPRLRRAGFTVQADRTLAGVQEQPDGGLLVELDDGQQVPADHAVLATGYRPDAATLPFLAGLLPALARSGDTLALDEGFQTSLPGLFVTGALATTDFGPFFGFTLAARPAAAVLGAAVRRHLQRVQGRTAGAA